MTKAVVDRDGVMLEVHFEPEVPPLITSVRVLGEDYQATGPELKNMLDNMFFLTSEEDAQHFLNAVGDEISVS
jgi:hypothetical protein